MVEYIATLCSGSGIGSAFLGIIDALYYLQSNNIKTQLLVNCYFASEPVKWFINVFLDRDNIDIIKFVNIHDNYYKKIYKNGDRYKELFFTEERNIYHIMQDNSFDFDILIKIFEQVWVLKTFIKEECNLLDKYDVCINVRRGDKITLESHINVASVKSYIDEIEKIKLGRNPKIFHTSDEYNTFLEIKLIKPHFNIETLCVPEEKGYFLADINKKDINYNISHIRKFMKQLHIMTTSDYFIGTLSTSVGFLVQLLRKIKRDEKNIYI